MLVDFFESLPAPILAQIGNIDLNIKSVRCNHSINTILQRTVLFGGKRLRPLLTYLMGDFFAVSFERLHLLAQSIEQVHGASLAHDDVVDNAVTRRGRETINAATSNKHAVLAGDYLLADVIKNLAIRGNLRLVGEMSQVISDLSEGEWLQLDASEERRYTREIISDIADKKTASVMSWCTQSPAIEGNLPEHMIQNAREFGRHLGFAFQLKDDVIDFSGESQKDPLLDVENGLVNSVVYEWLELNPEAMRCYLQGRPLRELWALTHLAEAITRVDQRATKHLDDARQLLGQMARELNVPEEKVKPIEFILEFIGRRKF